MNPTKFSLLCITMFVLTTGLHSGPASPPEEGIWYYEIGGAKPVSASANPQVQSISIGGSAQLGLGYSCLKFDPVLAVTDTLNEVKTGAENMLNAMTQAATGAIAALPAVILQRANPGLYDLFQNALVRAELTVDLATKSCEQIEAAIGNNKNPYEDLLVLSKGNDWKVQMGLGGSSVVKAKESVEQSSGSNGLPWIGGNAGGKGQDPIELTADVVQAGFNIQLNRAVDAKSSVPVKDEQRLTQVWNNPAAISKWVVKVLGEHEVTTCEGCDKKTKPGFGLTPLLEEEEERQQTELEKIVNSSNVPTLAMLEKISAPGIAITRDVIESIRELPHTERSIVMERIVAEIAVARTVEKAFLARRILRSGSQLPEVHANPVADEHVERLINDLDAETERLVFEARLRKELVSDTVVNLLRRSEQRNQASLSIPETPRRDPNPIIDGNVKKAP